MTWFESILHITLGTTLDHVVAIAQVLFYITIGAVAVLTYRRARATILQPFHGEIFKEQLSVLSDILCLFRAKSESDLRNECGLQQMASALALRMAHNYARIQFKSPVDVKNAPYSDHECFPGAIVPGKQLRNLSPHEAKKETSRQDSSESWDDHTPIPPISREYFEFERRIRTLLQSPVLPKAIIELLEEYLEVVTNNGMSLTSRAKEVASWFPEHYPTFDMLREASLSWIDARLQEPWEKLEPVADRIVRYIRSYYNIDEIESLRIRTETRASAAR